LLEEQQLPQWLLWYLLRNLRLLCLLLPHLLLLPLAEDN
jgi:hypothetical protein